MTPDSFPPASKVRIMPILAVAALVSVFAFVILCRSQNFWISDSRSGALQPGMTKSEVRRLFGTPSEARDREWIYRPLLCLEDLHIDFDATDRVTTFIWLD
jgi:hypothetical protein